MVLYEGLLHIKDPHWPTASGPLRVSPCPPVKSTLFDWCKRKFNGRAGGRVRTKDGSIIIIENQKIYVPHLRLENSYTAWGKEGRLKSLSPQGLSQFSELGQGAVFTSLGLPSVVDI